MSLPVSKYYGDKNMVFGFLIVCIKGSKNMYVVFDKSKLVKTKENIERFVTWIGQPIS